MKKSLVGKKESTKYRSKTIMKPVALGLMLPMMGICRSVRRKMASAKLNQVKFTNPTEFETDNYPDLSTLSGSDIGGIFSLPPSFGSTILRA